MQAGFAAFLFSFLAVTLAEMGDKTQLLAMAFATRFEWWKVLLGVFAATVLNHALAVALGSLLGGSSLAAPCASPLPRPFVLTRRSWWRWSARMERKNRQRIAAAIDELARS